MLCKVHVNHVSVMLVLCYILHSYRSLFDLGLVYTFRDMNIDLESVKTRIKQKRNLPKDHDGLCKPIYVIIDVCDENL